MAFCAPVQRQNFPHFIRLHGVNKVGLLGSLGEDNRDASIGQNVLDLERGIRFVNGYGYRTQRQQRTIEDRPFVGCCRQDRGAVAGAYSQGVEPLGQFSHFCDELRGTDLMPVSASATFRNDLVRVALRAVVHKLGNAEVWAHADNRRALPRSVPALVHNRSPFSLFLHPMVLGPRRLSAPVAARPIRHLALVVTQLDAVVELKLHRMGHGAHGIILSLILEFH